MKKLVLALTLSSISTLTLADSVRLSDGNSCNFDADDTPWELSFNTSHSNKKENGISGYNKDLGGQYDTWDNNGEIEVGATLKYKFGGPQRLDCSKLYNIQLRTKDAELKLLEQKLQILQSNASIQWD